MENAQIVTVSFFRYRGWRSRWWALQQMGRAPRELEQTPGLDFVKMLGSGGGNGFSIWPNFGVYGLLGVWEHEAAARCFMASNDQFAAFRATSAEHWTVFLRTVMVHGEWEGRCPFSVTRPSDPSAPVAVLTRATIRPGQLWRFWRFVPQVGRSIDDKPGLLFSIGVGELPLIQQATFSLWRDSEMMKNFAYRSRFHREVIKRTREYGWYSEELFARFQPYATEGAWQNGDPLGGLI